MTINTEMFQKVYDHIATHPENHDQGRFESGGDDPFCGTTRCIAGWAIHFHLGVEGSIYQGTWWTKPEVEPRLVDGLGYLSESAVYAADILGLTDAQAYDLFYDMENDSAVEKCLRYATKGDEA